MTVESSQQYVAYETDGVTTAFPVPFYFLDATHIYAQFIDSAGNSTPLTNGSDFTVSGAGNEDGGALTLAVAKAHGFKLYIDRQVPVTQETAYQQNSAFPAKTTETALDKLTMIAQQLTSEFGRAIRYPVTEYEADGTLPRASVRAGMLLGFDTNGDSEMVPLPASVGAGDLRDDIFISDVLPNPLGLPTFTAGLSTSVTLSRAPGSKANLTYVAMDGTLQGADTLALAGNVLAFLDDNGAQTPIPLGIRKIYVKSGTTLSTTAPLGGVLPTIPTIAALRALNDFRYTAAYVTSYYGYPYTPGNIISSAYLLDAEDTTTPDDGGWCIRSPMGAWKLIGGPDWYVEQFGAKGDGVTDDAPAIRAATLALPLRGGRVRFMGKQYGVASGFRIGDGDGGATPSTRSGVRWTGMGGGFGATTASTLIQATGAFDTMLEIRGRSTDIRIEGICFYLSGMVNQGIKWTAVSGLRMQDVTVKQYKAVGMYGMGGVAPTGNYNISNVFDNVVCVSTIDGHVGLLLDGNYASSNDSWLTSFRNCRFDYASANNANAAYFKFSDSILFEGCHLVGDPGATNSFGATFDANGCNGFPCGHMFIGCSINKTIVYEGATDFIREISFLGFRIKDNEVIPAHPMLRGFTENGVPFGGWGT